jgi:hypothetical protein
MPTLREEARDIPIIDEADICVLGGSCTGVFAAIRAARLGAKVCIVERHNCFGGVATSGLVNIWHSLYDTEFRKPIIAGLTLEFIERLKKRGAVKQTEKNPHVAAILNSEELKIELDQAVFEHKVNPHLHTFFCAPVVKDGELDAVLVEDKSGRGAIRAKTFIDATGDGDLCARLGLPTFVPDRLQPPTTCALFSEWKSLQGADLSRLLLEHGKEYGLPEGFAWGATMPGTEIHMLAGTRVYGRNCAVAEDLTAAEIEGRRQIRAMMDILRRHCPQNRLGLVSLASQIGIRETRHVKCQHQVTGTEVLAGQRFTDAIANGSYRVDVHHQEKPGITFKYLDGSQVYVRPGYPQEEGRWRAKTPESPTFYQSPFRSLVPGTYPNLILAGRMLDADKEAFAGIRVMVNMNQTGEAAGVAAWLALSSGKAIGDLDAQEVRKLLADGGSIII